MAREADSLRDSRWCLVGCVLKLRSQLGHLRTYINGRMAMFHSRTGSLVSLSNGNRTACRNHPAQEFNNGVVLSAEPMKDNQVFEVRIDKKINSWSGSIEIGVTTSDPANLNFPTSATGFREGTWVMSGCSILRGGHSTIEEYGRDLDQLVEGDRVGVMRTSAGVLHFLVNGADQGPAATGVPGRVYAVVDMYGKCAQVTTVDNNNRDTQDMVISNEITNEAIAEATFVHSNDRLVFHERCGSLVRLSHQRRTGERIRPLDEFNNGVVMTNRPLRDDELFEIRLDRLVDKWSGSIEVGITTHNPSVLEFPATMTNMRSGTIMMSGCGILTNGKGTRREYGEYNLDELTEGDRIGLMRKSSGALHYYINSMDQGVAATSTPQIVWGVVDLYGMAVKVTIVDGQDTPPEPELLNHRTNNFLRQFPNDDMEEEEAAAEQPQEPQPLSCRVQAAAANAAVAAATAQHKDNTEEGRLTFHVRCGSHAAVQSNQVTSHRPNAMDDFNNGVVLTSRHLRPNEMFEVRLDKMVDKWAGSIEIGVTTHSPVELDFPSTMTNIRSGTWMMTGNGVMHNGTTVIDEYGQNLDRLKVGDRVGVQRTEDGTLHFYVNSVDQGAAASNVPASVYGVIDLYGQAAQATIIDPSDPGWQSEIEVHNEADPDELRFHNLHGRNATITSGGKTACRPNARGEFNDAIVMSNRPLRINELFEVTVDRMVDRWSGSIEAGVTCILPEDLDFPNTMTDIDYDTWMLSGSAIMQDGSTVRNGYRLDLDSLTVGSRIGMMRCSDGTLHYYLDGVDQGVASTDITQDVFAVIDLYGQCAQVTITSGSGVRAPDNHLTSAADVDPSVTSPFSTATELTHRFSQCCGKNVAMKNNGCTACRVRNFNKGLIFSSEPLRNDELFEVKIDSLCKKWSGSLQIGVTTMAISDSLPPSVVPATAADLKSKVTWVVSGSEVKRNGVTIKENYAPSLERLEVNNRVGVKRCADSTMHIYINGEDMGVAATNVPKNVFALFDLYGMVNAVSIMSSVYSEMFNCTTHPPSLPSSDSSDSIEDEQDQDTAESSNVEFHANHGKNIQLSDGNLTATRVGSYNQGVVVGHRPLPRNKVFKVRLDRLSARWTSSLTIGVIGFPPDKFTFPVTAISIKKSSWLVQAASVYNCGAKIKEQYGPNLDTLQPGQTVGVLVDDQNQLHLVVDGADLGVAARDIPHVCYAVADLYGLCEQVTIVTDDPCQPEPSPHITDYREKADIEDGLKEKSGSRPQELVPQRNCDYQNMCNRLRATLALPDGFFTPELNRCYCDTCYKSRGDEPYYRQGEPLKDYALPFGWCKFALRIPPKAEMLNIFEKWHIAYHGTQVSVIRKILDTGDVLLPGDVSRGGYSLLPKPAHFDEKNKPDEQQDIKQILLSPTIRYSGSQAYAPKYEYRDAKTRKVHQARVAFQVCVKPGSYKIGPQSIGANSQLDPKFSNSEVEWATKERGATVLAALLIKLE